MIAWALCLGPLRALCVPVWTILITTWLEGNGWRSTAVPERLVGHVESGAQNAAVWLTRFNAAYARKPLRDTFGLEDGDVLVVELP